MLLLAMQKAFISIGTMGLKPSVIGVSKNVLNETLSCLQANWKTWS